MTVLVNNLPPTIISVAAEPSLLPENGGPSVITVTATDVAGDLPLVYRFDCDDDQAFEVVQLGDNSTTCTFTDQDVGPNTVNVRVADDDGDTAPGSTTVNVGVSENQWDASLVITADSPDLNLNAGVNTLTFGIHPDAQDTGDAELDEGIPPPAPQPYIFYYFDYPNNDEGFTQLFTSRISPPGTVRDILRWPLRIEVLLASQVTSPDGIDINVSIDWIIETVPPSFLTAMLIDHGSDPANQVLNMSGPGPYPLTIHIPQGGIIAFRDLTVAVSRSHVQALVLYDQWNMAALTVEPDSRNKDDILTDVVGASVITWDPQARTYVVSNELIPGNGYWIKAIGNAVQLIPGDPIEENVRGAAP